jgi:hypothetical protein
MSNALPPVGAGAVSVHDSRDLALTQTEDAAFSAGLAADPSTLGRDLLNGLAAASEHYRQALAMALDPGVSAMKTAPSAGARSAAASGVSQPGSSVAPTPGPHPMAETATPGGEPAPLLSQTERASEQSLALLLDAHSQIMRRQVGVMSATTTLDAASSGARRSSQNIDTLLRGQ